MENESTFVAPEGVYSVTEEHKSAQGPPHTLNNPPAIYPTRLSAVVVRFPAAKQPSAPGFVQLLGGNKDSKKEKPSKEREDGASISSSDTLDEGGLIEQPTQDGTPTTSSIPNEPHNLFSHPAGAGGKKKSRPKHNIRTTSSTFITRMQAAEGLTKLLQSKQGDYTFWFYNLAKTFLWMEAGLKSKVYAICVPFFQYSPRSVLGTIGTGHIFCISDLPRREPFNSITRTFGCYHRFPYG
jgi:catabolite repression protein CreC